ncbi:hypothetical protein TELCIR_10592 [Teladorsagia circumcincta]|uniref:Uncharacterized protein n=1 Tax=Teladorsagia circumcincta TaxID=45464 RepID=A0A2G9UD28_TELCI|nr:hypothetical protein TELCIR_10592 [Teladorsagia circumcincta]
MLFVCVIRLFVGLNGVVLTLGANIDDATFAKAINGEWVPLPNGSEDMVKFVRSNVLGTGNFTYKQLDDFCEKDDSLFVSFPSEEDKNFVIVSPAAN